MTEANIVFFLMLLLLICLEYCDIFVDATWSMLHTKILWLSVSLIAVWEGVASNNKT